MRSFLWFFFFILSFSPLLCAEVQMQTHDFFDASRGRNVPVAFYTSGEPCREKPLVLINHGYGGSYKAYTYIAHALAEQGYLVASVQQDLEGDPPLPREGNILELRMPFYEQGIETILYLSRELETLYPAMCFEEMILIGHSNGGDIVMAFTDRYPKRVLAAISLDSFRYPFPVEAGVPILGLRAADNELPSEGSVRVKLADMVHNAMDDTGPDSGKRAVVEAIETFLATVDCGE